MKRSLRRLTLVGGLMMLMSIGLVDVASAGHVSCGQTITADTTLDTNVGPCTGNGVVVGASGTSTDPITLNLGGKTISGVSNDTCGVLVTGKSYVEIKGPGTVTTFSTGVCIEGGSSNVTVDGVTADANVGSTAFDHGDGIVIDDSSFNKVVSSTISNNGPYAGITLLGNSDSNTIGATAQRNTIKDNNVPSGTSNQDAGIRLEPDYGNGGLPNTNTIQRNTITGSGLDGVEIFAAPSVTTTANVIKLNTIQANGFHAFTHRKGDGIHVFNRSNGNTIDENKVTGNAASGIVISGPLSGGIPGSIGNKIRNNSPVSGNGATLPPGTAFDQWDKNETTCPTAGINTWSGNLPLFPANTRNPTCLG